MLKCPASITALRTVSTWDAEKRWHCMHNYILHCHLPYPSLQAVELMKSNTCKGKNCFHLYFHHFFCVFNLLDFLTRVVKDKIR